MYGRGHGTGEKSLTRRPRTAAQKAADVAASIRAHGLDVTDEAMWIRRYGLEGAAQQALVRTALEGNKR